MKKKKKLPQPFGGPTLSKLVPSMGSARNYDVICDAYALMGRQLDMDKAVMTIL